MWRCVCLASGPPRTRVGLLKISTWARDLQMAEAVVPGIRASNPDLEPLRRIGGKLISYVGWDDPIVPA